MCRYCLPSLLMFVLACGGSGGSKDAGLPDAALGSGSQLTGSAAATGQLTMFPSCCLAYEPEFFGSAFDASVAGTFTLPAGFDAGTTYNTCDMTQASGTTGISMYPRALTDDGKHSAFGDDVVITDFDPSACKGHMIATVGTTPGGHAELVENLAYTLVHTATGHQVDIVETLSSDYGGGSCSISYSKAGSDHDPYPADARLGDAPGL
jgi:hypothetical protein